MKKWVFVTLGVLMVILGALGFSAYQQMREEGFFRDPVFETVPPTLPPLERPAVLVFSKTNAFIHRDAIPAAQAMIQRFGEANGWSVYLTDNGAIHNPDDLARFDVVVWNNVTGDVLTTDQRQAFVDYVKSGGGWVGIHGSGDRSHNWQWYEQALIAAEFVGHPMGPGGPQFQAAVVRIEARDDPIVSHLPQEWTRTDEWYSFVASPRDRGVIVLATLDPSSYSPRMFGRDISMGDDHPIVWKQCIEDGRAFYSAMGHTAESYEEPGHVIMLERAIAWAAGLEGTHCE